VGKQSDTGEGVRISTKSAGRRRGTTAWLTAVQVRNAREPGRYPDGDRLWLVVRPTGKREWFFRYTSLGGRKRDMALGNAEVVGLVEARTKAAAARAMLAADPPVDPLDERHARRRAAGQAELDRRTRKVTDARTLARAARTYHESIEAQFRNAKHRAQWINSLEQHVPVELWKKPLADIGASELVDAMAALERRVPETGRRIRQRINAVLDNAVVRGWVDRNPMIGVTREVRRMVGKRKTGQFAALPYAEAPAFMQALRKQEGTAARALELLVMTAARTGEVLGAQWSEFDLAVGTWLVPAERMKAGEAHTVFLPDAAIVIVRALPVLDGSPYLFPSPMKPEQPLSNMAMLVLLGRMDMRDRTTVHGLRSTFSTWANETTSFKPDIVEAALAHKEADRVRAAYNRATFDADRRTLLATWARFLTTEVAGANVTQIRAAG
jgi:integrase